MQWLPHSGKFVNKANRSVCILPSVCTRHRLWSDRDQIWRAHADSYGKGSGPNKNLHCDPGAIWGVFRGEKFKNLEKLRNGWTDWHHIWHACSDLPGYGHRRKNFFLETLWWHLGGFRGSQIQKSGETTKRMGRLAPNLVHMCGFIWEWT